MHHGHLPRVPAHVAALINNLDHWAIERELHKVTRHQSWTLVGLGWVKMSNMITFSPFSAHNHTAILTESFRSCSPKIGNESGSLECSLFCFHWAGTRWGEDWVPFNRPCASWRMCHLIAIKVLGNSALFGALKQAIHCKPWNTGFYVQRLLLFYYSRKTPAHHGMLAIKLYRDRARC